MKYIKIFKFKYLWKVKYAIPQPVSVLFVSIPCVLKLNLEFHVLWLKSPVYP